MPAQHTKKNLPTALLCLVDGLLAALVIVLPFLMGGREAWGHWFLLSVAFLLGSSWSAYAVLTNQRYHIHWLELFFAAGLALVCFQIQPLSVESLQQHSEEYQRLIPQWALATQQTPDTHWNTLSLAPAKTSHGMWVFLAYFVIFTVTTQRLRTLNDCQRLMKTIAVTGAGMVVFAFVQKIASNGQFFWVYDHPFTDTMVHLKGAFTNRNHFAQFAALSLPTLLWWLTTQLSSMKAEQPQKIKGRRSDQSSSVPLNEIPTRQLIATATLAVLVVVVAAAVLLSESRGGIIAGTTTALIALIGLFKRFESKAVLATFFLGGGLLFFSVLAFAPQEELQARVDQLLSADADKVDAGGNRRAIWKADAEVIRRFPWFGTGVGSHQDVYPLYMEDFADHATAVMTHAESSFVNVALETGLVGIGILISALLFLLVRLTIGSFRKAKSSSKSLCIVVLAAAVGASLHAVVDFIWYAPAIVVTSLMLTAIGLRASSFQNSVTESHSTQTQGIIVPRPLWATMGGFCVLAFIVYQPTLFSRISSQRSLYKAYNVKPTVAYEDVDDDLDEFERGEITALRERRLSEDEMAVREDRRRMLEHEAVGRFYNERIRLLTQSLMAEPNQHRVQLMLAQSLLLYFDYLQEDSESRMPLLQVRDAAVNSDFQSASELQAWCRTAFSENIRMVFLADKLARASLKGCPIQGNAYLTIMRTDFLNDPTNKLHQPLIDQSLLVRGYDPEVQYVAGHEALFEAARTQNLRPTLDHWSKVFHVNSMFRMKIIQQLAGRTDARFFLHNFQPNIAELRDLLAVYEALEREDEAKAILQQICEVVPKEAPTIEKDEDRLNAHLDAYAAARRLENLDLALEFLDSAIEQFPYEFVPRYQMGMTLVELERPEDALPYLEWCHDHDPAHEYVKKLIRRAEKLKIRPAKQQPAFPGMGLTQLGG